MIPPGPMPPELAFVRAVPTTYPECMRAPGAHIDLAAAQREHDAYVEALRSVGATVAFVPPAPELPDSVFVEDAGLVLSPRAAVLTRPGAAARLPEVHSVKTALAAHGPVAWIGGDARLDGGDVLRCAGRLFVGLSTRTNAAGVEALRAIASAHGLAVSPVRVRAGLHLKSACTLVDPSTVLCLAGQVDPEPFVAAGITLVEPPEPAGANVLALGPTMLVSAAAPATADWARARGFEVISVPIDQFHRGDGALSCLSIRVPPSGGWCV